MKANNLTQELAVATRLTPAAARAAGSYVTPAILASKFERLVALLQIGTLSGSATVLAKFQHNAASASDDGGWADVNSACVTSAFASTSNDKLGQLELRVDQYPALSAYVRILTSAATSSWLGGCEVLGMPRHKPATEHDSADVVQTFVY
jgi:hypothetical protein